MRVDAVVFASFGLDSGRFAASGARERRAVAATRAIPRPRLSNPSTSASSAASVLGLPRDLSRLCVTTYGKCLKLRRCQPEDCLIGGPTAGLQPRRPSIERWDGLPVHHDRRTRL